MYFSVNMDIVNDELQHFKELHASIHLGPLADNSILGPDHFMISAYMMCSLVSEEGRKEGQNTDKERADVHQSVLMSINALRFIF